jgi:hypothetical protein
MLITKHVAEQAVSEEQVVGMVAYVMDVLVLDIVRCLSNAQNVSIPAGIVIVDPVRR